MPACSLCKKIFVRNCRGQNVKLSNIIKDLCSYRKEDAAPLRDTGQARWLLLRLKKKYASCDLGRQNGRVSVADALSQAERSSQARKSQKEKKPKREIDDLER